MVKPNVGQLNHLHEIFIQKYERYLPTAFDGSLTILEKMNKIINYLNDVGKLVNVAFDDWNEVMEWVMNDGLNEAVINKLLEMEKNGELETLINVTILGSKARIEVDENEPINPDEQTFWFKDDDEPNNPIFGDGNYGFDEL